MDKAIQIEYNPLFEYKCECAAIAGFDCIAVNYTKVLGKTESEWKAITEDIARILDKTGLRCHQTHPHYYDLFISSEILEEEMEFNIRQSIISGSALGAKYHVIHPRTSTTGAGYGSRTSLKDNLRWIGGLLDCAKKHGSSIAVENLPIFPGSGRLFYFYSANVEDHMELVDTFNDPNLVACWDFGHANMSASDQAQTISMMGSRIRCTHVHNNFGYGDRHLPPDCGDIKWEEVMPALAKTGYNGALTLETHSLFQEKDFLLSFAKHNYAGLVHLEKLMKATEK